MSSEQSSETLPSQTLDSWFLDLLACPACEQHLPLTLNESKDALLCGCGRYAYPIRDGIPVLLVEEATEVNPDARPDNADARS